MTAPLRKKISLGLQGAGTYGAFTWGVLDRLLDEENFAIDSISGSSSGAVNAVVLADGYAFGGGRHGAQQALRRFWTTLGQAMTLSPLARTPLDRLAGNWTLEYSPIYHLMEMAAVFHGPVLETPLSQNPLRNMLTTLVDFDRVRGCEEMELFVAATNVRTGAGRIFTRQELDPQRVVASACLPTVFAAVEVDGESYWDGSFVANPPLAPFLVHGARDVLVVQNNPISRSKLPRSMADIGNRANEIAFNISFLRELSALQHGQGIPDELRGDGMVFGQPRVHMITGIDMLGEYDISSKLNGELNFLHHLHAAGAAAADAWLRDHAHEVGVTAPPVPDKVYGAVRTGS
jgi:NTE family protein